MARLPDDQRRKIARTGASAASKISLLVVSNSIQRKMGIQIKKKIGQTRRKESGSLNFLRNGTYPAMSGGPTRQTKKATCNNNGARFLTFTLTLLIQSSQRVCRSAAERSAGLLQWLVRDLPGFAAISQPRLTAFRQLLSKLLSTSTCLKS